MTSLFGMIKRVKDLEGWAGLYKGQLRRARFSRLLRPRSPPSLHRLPGIFPYIISHSINFAITIIFLGASSTFLPSGAPSVPNPSGIRMAIVSMVITFVSLPLLIITNRCVCYPLVRVG